MIADCRLEIAEFGTRNSGRGIRGAKCGALLIAAAVLLLPIACAQGTQMYGVDVKPDEKTSGMAGAGEPKYCMVSLGDVVLLSFNIGGSFILLLMLSPDADTSSAIGAAWKAADRISSALAA